MDFVECGCRCCMLRCSKLVATINGHVIYCFYFYRFWYGMCVGACMLLCGGVYVRCNVYFCSCVGVGGVVVGCMVCDVGLDVS